MLIIFDKNIQHCYTLLIKIFEVKYKHAWYANG